MQVGGNANLVVLNQPNVLEALREHSAPRVVVSHGKVVDQTKMESMWKQ
ncbi:MAG TPA: hypothetical protein PKH47_14115 [Anaerolineales bacterium]|nr:hypothetical protein [Anaerolineales bacterium]